jgi:hypothetical protein
VQKLLRPFQILNFTELRGNEEADENRYIPEKFRNDYLEDS